MEKKHHLSFPFRYMDMNRKKFLTLFLLILTSLTMIKCSKEDHSPFLNLNSSKKDMHVSPQLIKENYYKLKLDTGFRADTNQLYIKATTNGGHSIKSNHYRGIAVDIAQINGSNVLALGPNNHLVVALQNAFEKAPNRRENYGPAFERKWGQPWPVGGHENHLHFSVDGN